METYEYLSINVFYMISETMGPLITLLLLSNIGTAFSSSDLFSSMSDMEELYQHEIVIADQMTQHLKVRFLPVFICTYICYCSSHFKVLKDSHY